MTGTQALPPHALDFRVYPSSSSCELVSWGHWLVSHVSHDYASAAQHAGVFFLLAGAVMLLVMLVITFCMTNMTDKLAVWFLV
jgi:hypothetical protein